MVLILGAGLAGLSAAHHLPGRDRLLVERSSEVGGLCRSIREEGFTFDYTGHLLHLRDPGIESWIDQLLPDALIRLDRSAWVRSHGMLTPYPFQVNTAGLPIDVRLECLLGFIETLRHPERRQIPVPEEVSVEAGLPFLATAPPPAADEPSFLDWIHHSFGSGFAKHFFVPYNTKLWRRDLAEVTGDWVSWSIPRPELRDVLRGAIAASDRTFGYNARFLYPKDGGIDHLPRAIAADLPPGVLLQDASVVEIEAGNRRVLLDGGETHDAELILTSIPLPALTRMTSDLPAELREEAERLRWVSVRAVNLGLRGPAPHPDAQWIYFPEEDVPFYRLGLPSSLCPAMAPEGHHSLVAEIAFRPEEDPEAGRSLDQTTEALAKAGLLHDADDIVYSRVIDSPEAYVVFDRDRRRVLPRLYRWYLDRGIVPMGRYGSWDYLSMEDCLLQGRQAAAWCDEKLR
jgi:protoporphyrinogen oxidase